MNNQTDIADRKSQPVPARRRSLGSLAGLVVSLAFHGAFLTVLGLITWVITVSPNLPTSMALDETVGPEAVGTGGTDPGSLGDGEDNRAVGPVTGAMEPRIVRQAGGALTNVDKSLAAMGQVQMPDGVGASATGAAGQGGTDPNSSLFHTLSGADGVAGGTPSGAGGKGSGGLGMYGTGKGFGDLVGQMRGKGLDVVIVIDATNSMVPYIAQTKKRLRDFMDVVTGLVPDTRLGIVAFKDYGDDYGVTAVKSLKITDKADAVRKFLDDVIAGGGGDDPEPIHEALKEALYPDFGWRGGRTCVVLLVTDAPVHPSGKKKALELAKALAKRHGTINVIDVGGGDGKREQVLADLAQIAKEGGGSSYLLQDDKRFWRDLVMMVFGERFKGDVDVIIDRYVKDKKEP